MAPFHLAECMDRPTVSVIIPMRNEGAHIGPCLDSILGGDYPSSLLEILVVDGRSTDGSDDIVRRYAALYPRIRLIDNPRRTSAAAMNLGLSAAQHEIIVRIDAHALYAPDYISESVAALALVPGAGGAAGLQRAEGKGYWQGAIAAAMAHPFGSGGAKYRRSDRPCWVDTIFLGAWRRDVALAVGGFDPSWKINADYEFNIRLRRAGYGLFLSPSIKSTYFPRASVSELARQYFRYGFWRVRTVLAHPRDVKLRQFVAPLFLLSVATALALAPHALWPLALVLGTYVLGATIAAVQAGMMSKVAYVPALPIVFATMHLFWGTGFLVGLVRWAPEAAHLRRSGSADPAASDAEAVVGSIG